MSRKFSVGVMSDSHLRDTQWNTSDRSKAFLDAVLSGIAIADTRGVRTLVHGGDILQSNRPGPDTTFQLREIDADLRRRGMCMLIVSGNHDVTPRKHWLEVEVDHAANWHSGTGLIYLANTVYKVQGGPTVFGVTPVENMVGKEAFLRQSQAAEPADILLWHGPVQEFLGAASPYTLSIEEIPAEKFGAVVIGDTHVHSVLYNSTAPTTPIISPGSTEVHTIEEVEHSPVKFITFLDFVDGRVVSVDKAAVASSPCFVFKILSEADIDPNLAKLTELAPDCPSNAVVLVRYVVSLADEKIRTLVLQAMASAVNRGVFVKICPLPFSKEDPVFEIEATELETMPQLLDCLSKSAPHPVAAVNQIRQQIMGGMTWEANLDALLEDILAGKASSVA